MASWAASPHPQGFSTSRAAQANYSKSWFRNSCLWSEVHSGSPSSLTFRLKKGAVAKHVNSNILAFVNTFPLLGWQVPNADCLFIQLQCKGCHERRVRNGVRGFRSILSEGESSILIRRKILIGCVASRAKPQRPAENQRWLLSCCKWYREKSVPPRANAVNGMGWMWKTRCCL